MCLLKEDFECLVCRGNFIAPPYYQIIQQILGRKEMDYITIIGLSAAAMGGISLFPQVLKVIRTKSTKDISREMFLLLAGSIFLWLIYGLLLKDLPIIIANFFGFVQTLIILFFKIKNQINESRKK